MIRHRDRVESSCLGLQSQFTNRHHAIAGIGVAMQFGANGGHLHQCRRWLVDGIAFLSKLRWMEGEFEGVVDRLLRVVADVDVAEARLGGLGGAGEEGEAVGEVAHAQRLEAGDALGRVARVHPAELEALARIKKTQLLRESIDRKKAASTCALDRLFDKVDDVGVPTALALVLNAMKDPHVRIITSYDLQSALFDAGKHDLCAMVKSWRVGEEARRDEEKSRAKERIFSFRNAQHAWDPKNQRPELWSVFNTKVRRGESLRVFPLSNWTELDIWQYIRAENIPIVPLYYAAERPVVERDGMLVMVDDKRMPLATGETPELRRVRFRTLGCYPLTAAMESEADTLDGIVTEMLIARTSERSGRLIDHDEAASMEKKKREGYF